MPISLLFNPFRRDNVTPDDDVDETVPEAPQASSGTCHARDRVTVTGVLRHLTVNPQGQRRWMEAELDDGSGPVTVVWMGRDQIAGIAEGVRVKVSGRVVNRRGRQVIYNPHYALLPD